MSYKLTCPGCDTYTSEIFRAYEDGYPCPYCGSSLQASSEQYYRQLPDDHRWNYEKVDGDYPITPESDHPLGFLLD